MSDVPLKAHRSDIEKLVFFGCVGALAVGAGALLNAYGWQLATLFMIGGGLGVALYVGTFSFAGGYRQFLVNGRSAAIRAQMAMLAIAVLLFFPALAAESVAGQPVRGFVFAPGLEMAIGAFLFGIGMQIGGGCASGTLYTAGGGNLRMVVTLIFFIIGMTLGAWDAPRWEGLPALPPISLPDTFGMLPALALNLAAFALIAFLAMRRERRMTGSVEPLFRRDGSSRLRGLSPLLWAAVALALLNFATLVVAGRPWGIVQAFATWGSLAAEWLGLAEPVWWPYWEDPTRVDLLHRPLNADATTLMNIGLMLGACLAACWLGRFRPDWRIGLRPLAAAIVGGLLLGYGARMASGCNISAFFSGVASGSLHGWLWIACAMAGNVVGTRLRPLFGLGG